ncbi:MAG: diaminopimelate epimerase [Rickettsiales bacterium]|nr:diaminopimelate epimerase [Rickettsiales bacterium]
MKLYNFTKMHGLGNDFLIFPWSEQLPQKNLIKALSSRSKGVGCDLVVFLVKLEKNIADYKTHFFNHDGTRAEICGNALRCIGKLHYERFNSKNCLIETDAGLIDVEINNDSTVCVDIGLPKFKWKDIPLIREMDGSNLGFDYSYLKNGFALNLGNPHLVFVVDKIDKKKLRKDSLEVRKSKIFPEGVNINVVEILKKNEISILTSERGAGVTEACGTGACASVIATNKMQLVESEVSVSMPGGFLKVEITSNEHIFMTGDATKVFEGKINFEDLGHV